MEYSQQEFEFVKRTQKIIEQYESLFKDNQNFKENYDVTLLINCMVGLLILPQQKWRDELPETLIEKERWGIGEKDISLIKTGEQRTVNNIVRHLRNSLSHYHFEAISDTDQTIGRIKFEDYSNLSKTKKTFEATIIVSDLRKFLNNFSQFMLDKMVKTKDRSDS